MFLKRIEMQGFKSFPEKIRLELKKGVTGIVGPNGSGKSNISDAIRWVLGEQSAKSLRGDKMEDIIFIGTKNRKPLGFCEVSIIIDNSKKKLNLDYEEVAVTRKVYRSGESNYSINKTSCRLKDIHELFMDTGIGKEGYSIIGQGKIDNILSNKSEDRKALFEEAVGIVKFRNRKNQAENRLKEVYKNLIRTKDIINELENRLIPLKEQTKKAESFIHLEEKLKLIKINIFKNEYENTQKNILDIQNDIIYIDNQIKEFEEDENTYKRKKQSLEKLLDIKESELGEFNEKTIQIIIDIEQKQSNINIKNENIKFMQNDIDRIQNEINKNSIIMDKTIESLNSIEHKKDYKLLKKKNAKITLDEIDKTIQNANITISEEQENTEKINNNILVKNDIILDIASRINFFESTKIQYKDNKEKMINELNYYKSKLNEISTRMIIFEKEDIQINSKFITTQNKFIDENKKTKYLQEEKNKLDFIYEQKNKLYTNLQSKYKILKDLKEHHEGYFNPIKYILNQRNTNIKFNGICGAIGELITITQKFEVAVEVALGSNIQNIITKTEKDAKIAINHLKENKKGRATFLPISAIKPRTSWNDEKIVLNEIGALTLVIDAIKYDEIYNQIMENILYKILIVDNIENALKIAKKYNNKFKIVTLSGEILNIGGSLTGGSLSKKNISIFSRERELYEISNEMKFMPNEIKNIKDKLNIIISQEQIYLQNINLTKEELDNISLSKIKLKEQQNQITKYFNDIKEQMTITENEINKLNDKMDNSFIDLNTMTINLEKNQDEIKNLKDKLLKCEIKAKQIRLDKDNIFIKLSDIKIQFNILETEIYAHNKDIQRMNEEINNTKNNDDILKLELKQKNEKKVILGDEIIVIKESILILNDENINLKKKFEAIYEDKAKILEDIKTKTNEINELYEKIFYCKEKKAKLTLKYENIQSNIENISISIWEEYKLTYANCCIDYKQLDFDMETLLKQQKHIKNKIFELGYVNLSAIEEYENVKNRYDINVAQQDDILKANENIKNIIQNLLKEMETKFKEEFKIINQNFNKVFSDMFGGGSAKLILSNENNILDSTIEIVASPPGKILQSLSLLSGGERTLTAMSILFAILKMKPSPFCILDETEAALDDANVIKYANFLKKFSEDNQFIIITHKTGTMEIADTLYGVTMEEQGVSKIISVELKDAKEY